ncbi:MAG: thioredoxin domain-containing protein [Ignavibacteriae bacterium]|nr:thioredoxin domain-containing protein [Ignavibacteriota bacterium]
MKIMLYTLLLIHLSFLTGCADENANKKSNKEEYMYTNKLIEESSPYLLEHAHNPVNWYPWGKEALEKAARENKPIIISIGYAACHWCHVMEHESFSDPDVAKVMNEHFVAIKVDREERPDIDNLYMAASILQNGRGGWPLNAFALPDGRPFFAGTYFPKENWVGLMEQISHLYKNEYEKLVENAEALNEGIATQNLHFLNPKSSEISGYDDFYETMHNRIDEQFGGLSGAPKFPMPSVWDFLLQFSYLTGSESAYDNVMFTLERIALSGTYDQLGGGFARYATDMSWKIPHFEKMLYDNGQLISTYSNAYKTEHNSLFKDIVYQTVDFVERELMNDKFGYYSSLNADSEGEEGKFYVWDYSEIKKVLTDAEFKLVEDYYGIIEHGNWEEEKNILHSKITIENYALKNELDYEDTHKLLQSAKSKLFKARKSKIRPSLDDKVITSWNALMISGLCDAYSAFSDERFLNLALKNADFLTKNMLSKDGSLKRIYKEGKVTIPAFLDDYTLLAKALLDLYQITFDKKWLDYSEKITEYTINNFEDKETKFYHYTHSEDNELSAKTMELQDNVIPASNSVMANLLFDLGHILYNENYIEKAKKMLLGISAAVRQSPTYHSNWALLQGIIERGIYEVAIIGNDSKKLANEMQSHYLPNCLYVGGTEENLPLLKGRLTTGTTIYVCKDKVCNLPTTEVEKAIKQVIRTEK